VKGDEVPQVYVGSPASPPWPMAVRALAGFERVSLHPGQTKHVTIHVARRAFQFWSVADHAWMTAWGVRETLSCILARHQAQDDGRALKPPAEEVARLSRRAGA